MNQIELPKLEDMCVLVTIKSGKTQLTKKDRNATRAAEHEMNAQDGAGSYTKLLYPKPLIQPIVAAEQRVRNYVKSICTVLDRNMWIAPKSFRQRIYIVPVLEVLDQPFALRDPRRRVAARRKDNRDDLLSIVRVGIRLQRCEVLHGEPMVLLSEDLSQPYDAGRWLPEIREL